MSSFRYEDYILFKYASSLLDSVKDIPLQGKFGFRTSNGYAFLSVDSMFGFMSKTILKNEGFFVRWTILKKRYPAAHISVMLPEEYRSVPRSVLESAEEEFKETLFDFKITGVKLVYHVEKETGDPYWLVAFAVECEQLEMIRKKIQLKKKKNYNPHLTVLEKKII